MAGAANLNEDMLVFGYACKLFRDDDKALFLDEGRHLIPWMGDGQHTIGRYDGRATLPNLAMYESPSQGGFNPYEGMSSEEIREEQMCQEER